MTDSKPRHASFGRYRSRRSDSLRSNNAATNATGTGTAPTPHLVATATERGMRPLVAHFPKDEAVGRGDLACSVAIERIDDGAHV
jgi:hypothetical protein